MSEWAKMARRKTSKMTTVRIYANLPEAQVAQSRLDSEGIPTFLKNEFTLLMQPLWSQAMGGVELQVPQEFLAEAREILDLPPFED